MKIAFTSKGSDLESELDVRFGRATNFIIYDTISKELAVVANTQNLNAQQGAGIQAATNVANAGVEAVVTGHCGPKAFRVLQAAEIKIYTTKLNSVSEALQAFEKGELEEITSADVEGHWV